MTITIPSRWRRTRNDRPPVRMQTTTVRPQARPCALLTQSRSETRTTPSSSCHVAGAANQLVWPQPTASLAASCRSLSESALGPYPRCWAPSNDYAASCYLA
ncbi:hypothetical protein ACLKA6_000172 [Drosophila palustris]